MYGVVYILANRINGKIYIGQTKQPIDSYMRGKLQDTRNSRRPLIKGIIKYGKENFEYAVLDVANSPEELNTLEREYILAFNSTDREIGYNADGGGNCGLISAEERNRRSISARKQMTGKKLSEETRKRMSAAHANRVYPKLTEEHKNKLRIARLGKPAWNSGKTISAETKLKISRSQALRHAKAKEKIA